MEDTQRDSRAADDTTAERTRDESPDTGAGATTLPRLLANPRRVRRA